MDNHSDEKANASRRRFAKYIISAAAALPLVSALANAQSERGRRRGARRPGATPRRTTQEGLRTDRNDHDTPPPVLIMEGSCIFEVASQGHSLPPHINMGVDRRHYGIAPQKDDNGHPRGNIYLAHIKIIDGSGEMLFRFDNTLKQAVEVTITDDDGDEMKISAAGATFLVDVRRSKKLAMRMGGADPSMNPVKRARFRYMNDDSNQERRMKFIKVSIGSSVLYPLDLDSLRSRGVELKVMIWWEGLS